MASLESYAVRSIGHRVAEAVTRAALRPWTALCRAPFDADLAAGADPQTRAALEVRAAQLVRLGYRRRLARSVERLIEELDADRGWWLSAAIPFLHDQVAEARGTLLAIADALRTAERVSPQGVAMVLQLLTDPACSPLYVPSARGALQLRAHAALECLLGERQPWFEVEPAIPPTIHGGWDGHG